eukprot:TRINITY_DN58732_c0_g1_i3.p1 TRINITY_DN58732_c0_g1~~TRINITY_DN58732_c0_g1_i3.p1  ORF type:complete len:233 (+),score=10.78 TRINITY_DN58732_c0_g1_i3:3-701(+)
MVDANNHYRYNSTSTNTGENEPIIIPELDESISETEIRQAISKLKTGKASGLDEISNEFLKSSVNQIIPFLIKLFNKLYDNGYFPDDWTRSVIVPLLKKGDANNPDNYRGISLLSSISKVFTSILNSRLYNWAEREKKICVEQAGFRKSYSTIDHIFSLLTMIHKSMNKKRKGKLYVAFVDYLKAFDTVNRESLWNVLEKVKTSTKMLKMLQGMYTSVQSCIRWGSQVSDLC